MFRRLGVSASLCRHLKRLNITNPTAIQSLAIPRLTTLLTNSHHPTTSHPGSPGRGHTRPTPNVIRAPNVVLTAPTGTGKMQAYITPIIDTLASDTHTTTHGVRAVVILPSLTLAHQVRTVLGEMGVREGEGGMVVVDGYRAPGLEVQRVQGLKAWILVGTVKSLSPLFSVGRDEGEGYEEEEEEERMDGGQVGRSVLDISKLRCVVVDEADSILRPRTRYAPLQRQKSKKRDAAITLLSSLASQTQGRFGAKPGMQPPVFVFVSATVNNPFRFMLKSLPWLQPLTLLSPNLLSETTVNGETAVGNIRAGKDTTSTPMPIPATITHRIAYLNPSTMATPSAPPIPQHTIESESSASPNLEHSTKHTHAQDGGDEAEGGYSVRDIARMLKQLLDHDAWQPALAVFPPGFPLVTLMNALLDHGIDSATVEASCTPTPSRNTPLLCTAPLVRGLDIPALRHVYSFLPRDALNANVYTHVAGRVGRMGKVGHVTSVIGSAAGERGLRKVLDTLGVGDPVLVTVRPPARVPGVGVGESMRKGGKRGGVRVGEGKEQQRAELQLESA